MQIVCQTKIIVISSKEMSRNQITNSDVVKKGLLKYRASKVKGTSGSSAQGVSVNLGAATVYFVAKLQIIF